MRSTTEFADRATGNVERVIVGKREQIELMMVASRVVVHVTRSCLRDHPEIRRALLGLAPIHVLIYYLSVIRRAGRQGSPRRGSQTPREYDATLGPRLPHARREMTSLTEPFVEARYSSHPIDRHKEREARAVWQQVKAALRVLRQRSEG